MILLSIQIIYVKTKYASVAIGTTVSTTIIHSKRTSKSQNL
jgi:hypothetical protein